MAFDILVLVVLLFSLLHGLIRGVLVQVFKLVGLLLVFVFGHRLALPLGRWLLGMFNSPERAEGFCLALAYVLLAGAALLVFSIVGHLVNKLVMRGSKTLGLANRLAGAGLSLVKGLIVCYLLACLLSTVPDDVERYRLGTVRRARDSSWSYEALMEFSLFKRARLQAAEVRYSLKEFIRLLRQTPRKEIVELPAYQEALQDPVLEPFLTDEALRAEVAQLLDDGQLVTLFEKDEVQRILDSPSRQVLVWKLIWQIREKHRAIVHADPAVYLQPATAMSPGVDPS